MTRILIADDHEVVRRGVRAILEARPDWEVVAEAADGNQAVELAAATRPDVAVLDFSLPLLNGLEVTRRIRQTLPKTQVLIFTMHDNEDLIRGALQAGARGYLLKSDADGQLVSAVEALTQQRPFFSWRVSEALLESFLDRRPGAAGTSPLTPREREIVQLIAEGKSNKEVGKHLNVSIKTVETHRAAAMRKVGASSTADLVRYAVRNHLIEP
ncbi:MAG TPA: response regulator transcription factor [Microvirga sp.]|jgi:DNA-binding NarL/FixJ family response regulator|nr:response regulator transcription factor [Microvirga sp.]